MKRIRIFLYIVVFTIFSGDAVLGQRYLTLQDLPQKIDTRVYYSVFVRSFYDSNGDGIGDIQGLISKLDYLQDLGIEGLWLLPVQPSPSYHKYDVTDYYGIDPEYGTLKDYRQLVSEAHKRHMKILLDLVVNHTSNLHPWFQQAIANPKSSYRNYYIWTGDTAVINRDRYHWYAVKDQDGNKLPGERYFGFFWSGMPDLNFDNKKVRKEIIKIARFWSEKIGVDGFRLDAARHIYPDDEINKTLAWWDEFNEQIHTRSASPWLVGEITGGTENTVPFLANGLDATFNFTLAGLIDRSVKEESDLGIVDSCLSITRRYLQANPNAEDAIFLTNHDMNRIMTELKGNQEQARIAASLLLTLPGNPFIYYGEEIGMLGKKPDEYIREPFLWNIEGEDQGQTSWEIPYRSSSRTVKPLAFQKKDPRSLYNHYRHLIHTRNNSRALRQGWLVPFGGHHREIVSFLRELPDERVLVLINLTGAIQKLDWPQGLDPVKVLYGTHKVFKKGEKIIYLQPYATFILQTRVN